MQAYVDNLDNLPANKQAARMSAEADMDWSYNSQDLPRLFAQVVKRPSHERDAAEQQARNYDLNHFTSLTLQQRHPRLYRVFTMLDGLKHNLRIV